MGGLAVVDGVEHDCYFLLQVLLCSFVPNIDRDDELMLSMHLYDVF